MARARAVLLLAVLSLVPFRAPARGLGPVDSRLILVFDMRVPGWTVSAKLRLLPTFGLVSVWGITGTVRCNGDTCLGRRARIAGFTRAGGHGFNFQAPFRRGVCTFSSTISDPTATNQYSCVDPQGNVTLQDTFHVGACRCLDRKGVGAAGFCATHPCPF